MYDHVETNTAKKKVLRIQQNMNQGKTFAQRTRIPMVLMLTYSKILNQSVINT